MIAQSLVAKGSLVGAAFCNGLDASPGYLARSGIFQNFDRLDVGSYLLTLQTPINPRMVAITVQPYLSDATLSVIPQAALSLSFADPNAASNLLVIRTLRIDFGPPTDGPYPDDAIFWVKLETIANLDR